MEGFLGFRAVICLTVLAVGATYTPTTCYFILLGGQSFCSNTFKCVVCTVRIVPSFIKDSQRRVVPCIPRACCLVWIRCRVLFKKMAAQFVWAALKNDIYSCGGRLLFGGLLLPPCRLLFGRFRLWRWGGRLLGFRGGTLAPLPCAWLLLSGVTCLGTPVLVLSAIVLGARLVFLSRGG